MLSSSRLIKSNKLEIQWNISAKFHVTSFFICLPGRINISYAKLPHSLILALASSLKVLFSAFRIPIHFFLKIIFLKILRWFSCILSDINQWIRSTRRAQLSLSFTYARSHNLKPVNIKSRLIFHFKSCHVLITDFDWIFDLTLCVRCPSQFNFGVPRNSM